MILPIIAYGNDVLRKQCRDVSQDTNNLNELLTNMWKTLKQCGGVGLAAPQVKKEFKTFIVNSKLMYDDLSGDKRKSIFPEDTGITETFLNARIISKSEDIWNEYESCLSIPGRFLTCIIQKRT